MQSEPGAHAPAGGIPLSVPEISGNEWTYVKECLDTGWVSVGPFVERFERNVARVAGTAHAVATTNATAALHIALDLAGVGPDDEVVVPALTFIAPAFAVRYLGAWPAFVDVEPEYGQLDPTRLAEFLDHGCVVEDGALRNASTERRVAALLPVHTLGHMVDMDPVLEIAERYELPVIEDAAEALGAAYVRDGWSRPAGSLGLAGCLSFNGNKVVTAGGGGMIVTDRAELAERARYLTTQAKDDPVAYVHRRVGFNYRISNVLAAIGAAQLEQLEEKVARKRSVAQRYAEAFADVPGLRLVAGPPWTSSAYWLSTVLLEDPFPLDNRALLARLAAQGIQARPLWQPLHRSPALAAAGRADCPVAEWLAGRALCLPSSTSLTEDEQQTVIDAVVSCC